MEKPKAKKSVPIGKAEDDMSASKKMEKMKGKPGKPGKPKPGSNPGDKVVRG